jgi:phosphoribosylamine---glycine ligase
MSRTDVLVVGSGGREHALAWKLAQSPRLGRLYAAPGNAGMAEVAECLPVRAEDLDGITRLARDREVGLVVIGPEAPLAAGLSDRLRAERIPVFGPSAAAARIESCKGFARELMANMDVPQPEFARFTDFGQASAYLEVLESQGAESVVVKASGLAAGKGAIVCDSLARARAEARAMLVERSFGGAGTEIVIEERLDGEEVSLFILTDGKEAVPLLPAQDYKRAYDDDRGPNTGGMGAYTPAPLMTAALRDDAMEHIVRPVLEGLVEEGAPFHGCLYAGLIRTRHGLRVIEFNCRFGDPETQALLTLLESDLLELLLACAEGRLAGQDVRWRPGCAVSVVMTSGGYPGSYQSGKPVQGLRGAAALPGVTVFHAGTALQGGEVVTAGGRVLNVTGTGATFAEARERAYAGVEQIRFEGREYRTDIGRRVA